MKKMGIIMILLISLSLVSYVLAETQIDPKKVHFYMYGAKTCPHCKKMKDEIPKQFGDGSLTYYEVVGNDENGALFSELYRLTGISGVPAIGIAYEGHLKAVIEGEFNISATTDIIKTSEENGGLILFTGGKAYLIKNQTHIRMLEMIFIEHKSAISTTSSPESTTPTSTSSASTGSAASDGVCGPGLIVGIALVPLFFRRER